MFNSSLGLLGSLSSFMREFCRSLHHSNSNIAEWNRDGEFTARLM